jgi:hypothetical protein
LSCLIYCLNFDWQFCCRIQFWSRHFSCSYCDACSRAKQLTSALRCFSIYIPVLKFACISERNGDSFPQFEKLKEFLRHSAFCREHLLITDVTIEAAKPNENAKSRDSTCVRTLAPLQLHLPFLAWRFRSSIQVAIRPAWRVHLRFFNRP